MYVETLCEAAGVISASDLRTPTRRQVLAGTLLLALSACADGNAAGGGLSPAEQALRRQTVDDEQRLLAAYAATAARHPGLAGTLAVPWRQHREHAARLADVGGASAGTSGANGTLSATPSATSSATPVPADAQAAVRALAALERSVAAARRQACAAAGRGLAPLLGTLAAAEQVHADVLLAGGRAAGADAGSGGGRA